MNNVQRMLFPGVGVVLLVALFGCSESVEGKVKAEGVGEAPAVFLAPVQAVHPTRGDISSFFESTSRIEAERRVDVMAKGRGQCLSVNAEVGDIVTTGQVLAQLEKEELDAQVRQARVRVQQQKTAFEIAERSVAEGIGAPVDRDNMRFAYEQAKASLELSELQLRYQTIFAPIGGIVTRRIIQPGMVVTPGVPVFSIVDPDSYILPVNLPEKDLPRVQVGQEARARIDAAPDREFKARIYRIYPSVDPLSGTVRVTLEFSPEDRPLLREAAFARVRLVMETRANSLLLPRDSVLEEEGRKYAYVLEAADTENVRLREDQGPAFLARRIQLETGLEQGDQVEIISGVTDASLVVSMGQHSLEPDALVTVTNLAAEMAARLTLSLDQALDAAKMDPGPGPSASRRPRATINNISL